MRIVHKESEFTQLASTIVHKGIKYNMRRNSENKQQMIKIAREYRRRGLGSIVIEKRTGHEIVFKNPLFLLFVQNIYQKSLCEVES